ncbi:hypothetical protein [Cellulosimicrobium cellulans]|uniref:hypothetical protein n=1 Tax=Cellulosimicrobium cellulans TaxID=1710 RepID=UPI003C63102E
MPDRRRFGRTPDTICLLTVLALSGAVLTLTGKVPQSVAHLVGAPFSLFWSATFTLAAAVSLVGVLWRDHLTGWSIEFSGRIALACTCLAYTVALVGSAKNWGAGIVIGVIFAVGVSSVWRVYQLVRRFDQFKADVLAYQSLKRRGGRG